MLTLQLDLAGVPVLVVGGGAVAARKLKGLPSQAKVTLTAPLLSPAARAQARRLRAKVRRRAFRASDARGKRLIFSCTDSPNVNTAVAKAARRTGAWVCVADDPSKGDVQVPAVGRAGRLSFTLSTGGASPALAKALRKDWERCLRASLLDRALGLLAKRRAWLKAHPKEKREALAWLTRPSVLADLQAPAAPAGRRALHRLRLLLGGKRG